MEGTVVSGIGAIVTGRALNARQAREILGLQKSAPPIPPGIMVVINGTPGNVPSLDEIPESAKTLYDCLAETVKGNPIVEIRLDPRQAKDALSVIIGPKY